ncbi:hypothetical protein L596_025978 [Steinernema carpocapsae]|uniref:Uncharacterized protein n=1 Tax=Steinernema carpocapsae TaxID=34508 RepID=A0A4U5LZY1_STECR|nr:hypothetical protein L596_025978 [Steinernema carpocapsae]
MRQHSTRAACAKSITPISNRINSRSQTFQLEKKTLAQVTCNVIEFVCVTALKRQARKQDAISVTWCRNINLLPFRQMNASLNPHSEKQRRNAPFEQTRH